MQDLKKGPSDCVPSDGLIVIGVCTYRRPGMLQDLLRSLDAVECPESQSLEILIVDNDPQGSAAESVRKAGETVRWPLHYHVEEQRGIACARNRVLEETMALEADYLVSVDDDGLVQPDWLVKLFNLLVSERADAAAGPQLWNLPPDAPRWQHFLDISPDYEQVAGKPRPTMKIPATNNVLMRVGLFQDTGLRFDTRYGLITGEDVDFFRRAAEAGAHYAFRDDAFVVEQVSPSRLTVWWRFTRWANYAGSVATQYRWRHGLLKTWAEYFPRAVSYLLTGPVLLLVSPFAGPKTMLKGLKHTASATGMLKVLLGRQATEYSRTHGF